MIGLYPAIQHYAEHYLSVSPLHSIYIEEVGNPNGIPLLFLHDGPGKGVLEDDRRLFDPKLYRIILFDQRGCGRSKPYACIEDNTTQDLLQDISAILTLLGIRRCVLFGEGWGATLALLYSLSHRDKVQGLILHSLFLARNQDLTWQFSASGGAAQLFPDHFKQLVSRANGRDYGALLSAYSQLLVSDNEIEKMAAAKAWVEWQAQIGNPHPEFRSKVDLIDADVALSMSTLQCHYFSKNCFISDNYIFKCLDSLSHLPIIMVHGRFDISNPLGPAYELCQHLSLAKLLIVPHAGHFDCEPGMIDALRKATELMAEIIAFEFVSD
ncbi:prolyl aminopeptidase [Moritella viscosa]|uniref:Proline iminopeptidase n=1 Tax=Moritella viscosa TaxID=80854 RepID=A0ABY1HHL9_9GAMM|nr:prolyl aminopeptidase [Moritella viscosa]SGY94074.1 Proline iminopeptidase [Moritella viscosa]SGZ05596.1 Proline iminopeptidase [Moritella viscosa]SHO26787.1 Proline iminopeptidase [Moritella viscosa]